MYPYRFASTGAAGDRGLRGMHIRTHHSQQRRYIYLCKYISTLWLYLDADVLVIFPVLSSGLFLLTVDLRRHSTIYFLICVCVCVFIYPYSFASTDTAGDRGA